MHTIKVLREAADKLERNLSHPIIGSNKRTREGTQEMVDRLRALADQAEAACNEGKDDEE